MARLTYKQLDIIKDKFEVDEMWSFSKVSTFSQCSWLFKLKYIDKIRVKGDSCYTWWGTVSHALIQDFYDGAYTYEEMAEKLEDKILEYNMLDDPKLAFPEQSQFESYIENLRHYFSNVKTMTCKVTNEKPVLAVFEGNERYVFQGYIDSEMIDEDGNLVILDYKTSSMSGFTGAKLLEKARQLMIYAWGISQHGRMVGNEMKAFPVDKIILRYDMMKYVNVRYMQKNGVEKVTKAERRMWVSKLGVPIRKDFESVEKDILALEKKHAQLERKHNAKVRTEDEKAELQVQMSQIIKDIEDAKVNLYDIIEINELVDEAITSNSLSNLPKFIQEKYVVSDCYIDIELTQDIMDEFVAELVSSLDLIVAKRKEEDTDQAFTRERIGQGDSFFCVNLCDMKDHCSYYQEYKEHQSMFADRKETVSDDDLLAMIGLS